MALRVVFQQLLLLSSIVGKQIGSILTAGTSYCCSLCACCPLKKSIKVYVFNNAHRRFQGKRRLLDVRLFVAKFFHFYLIFSMENCIVNIFVDSALHFSSLQNHHHILFPTVYLFPEMVASSRVRVKHVGHVPHQCVQKLLVKPIKHIFHSKHSDLFNAIFWQILSHATSTACEIF